MLGQEIMRGQRTPVPEIVVIIKNDNPDLLPTIGPTESSTYFTGSYQSQSTLSNEHPLRR